MENIVSYVTAIERLDKKKSVITVDETFKFPLYHTEVKKYQLFEYSEFTEEHKSCILHELLPSRARQRVLYMLRDSDKSESDIRTKLMASYYPIEVIEAVIVDMKELHYIDDIRYTRQYILAKGKVKSLQMIRQELCYHGVSKTVIDTCFSELALEESLEAEQVNVIRKEFIKKRYDFTKEEPVLKSKIINSLLRKGFLKEDIMRVYREMTELY